MIVDWKKKVIQEIDEDWDAALSNYKRANKKSLFNKYNRVTKIFWWDLITLVTLGIIMSLSLAVGVLVGDWASPILGVIPIYFAIGLFYIIHEYKVMNASYNEVDEDFDDELEDMEEDAKIIASKE